MKKIKIMRILMVISLLAIMIFAFCSCGNKECSSTNNSNEKTITKEEAVEQMNKDYSLMTCSPPPSVYEKNKENR